MYDIMEGGTGFKLVSYLEGGLFMLIERSGVSEISFAARPPESIIGLMARAAAYVTAKGPLGFKKERAQRISERGIDYSMTTTEGLTVVKFHVTQHLKWPNGTLLRFDGHSLTPDAYLTGRMASLVYTWARQIWADPCMDYIAIATATTAVRKDSDVMATIRFNAMVPELLDPFMLQLKRDLRPWLKGEAVILPLEYQPDKGTGWTILAPANAPHPPQLLENTVTAIQGFLDKAFGETEFMLACDKACRDDGNANQ